MRNIIVVAGAVATLGLGLTAPAVAATSGDTTATFTLGGGALSMTVPAAVSFGTAPTGSTNFTGSLGNVNVVDARGLLGGTWTALASTTPFTTAAGTPAETVAAANVHYSPGTATSTSGTATFTPGSGGAMTGAQTAYSEGSGAGNNSATWNPTISVTVPSTAVAGQYTAVITHSVS